MASGSGVFTWDVEGLRVTPLVCYDLRFPEPFRLAAEETDLFAVIANWPERRRRHWSLLLAARAVENLGKLSFDQLFLGVTGYQESCGFTCGLDDEAVFKEACIEHSGETIVLMDSSKEDRRSTFPICELGDVSCVVTDGGTTDEFATACRESGVELL